MKTTLYNHLIAFLVCWPLVLTAHIGGFKGRYTKEKTLKKQFSVDRDALLKIDNSYGNLHITSWDQDRILIEVHIKTNGNNEEKVQRKLDQIRVEFEGSARQVSARTIFGNDRDGWGWGSGNKVNMRVNYTIRLPVKNSVHLKNDYGAIILDRIDGHAKIYCDYGRLDIGELRGRNNQLSFDYTSNSTIEYMKSGTLSADYSGFTVENAEQLVINADYTNSKIERTRDLKYACDYGKIEVQEVDNIEGKGDYIGVYLGTVHGNVRVRADYGSLKIARLDSDAGNVSIETDYTGIKVGYAPDYFFDFEISTSYAGVNGTEDFEKTTSEVRSASKYLKGRHGPSGSGKRLMITSDYGGITFYKN